MQAAINAFLASGNNLTNLAGKSIATTPVIINPLGGSFYINCTALPPATEGQNYTATLTATGGAPPYTWTVTQGSALPGWLSLAANGVSKRSSAAISRGLHHEHHSPFFSDVYRLHGTVSSRPVDNYHSPVTADAHSCYRGCIYSWCIWTGASGQCFRRYASLPFLLRHI